MGENSALSQRNWTSIDVSLLRKELQESKQPSSDTVLRKQTWNTSSSVPHSEQNSDSDQDILILNPSPSNCDNSLGSLEQQKDFNYSQKLFHIADGNLYSIFSPIQGRSYGMKPSFLRKQKYTVQECHGRGRKNSRKGLKFHNFLPSESVTSEKDGGSTNSKWKVYSECRLREEHGTKQISISNYSQSVPKKHNKISPYDETALGSSTKPSSPTVCSESMLLLQNNLQEELETKLAPCSNANFMLNSFQVNEEQTASQFNQKSNGKSLSSHASKTNSLDILLKSLSKKTSMIEKISNSDESDSQSKTVQKHRRKPVQTRRIVPYKKYLSIVEENDTLPLDLSSKCLIEKPSSQPSPCVDDAKLSFLTSDHNVLQHSSSSPICDRPTEFVSHFVADKSDFSHLSVSDNDLVNRVLAKDMAPDQQSPSVDALYPFSIGKTMNLGNQNFLIPPPPPLIGLNDSGIFDTNPFRGHPAAESTHNVNPFLPSSHFSIQKSVMKEVQSRPRRRNQRSVMKQKLEDTFRQNGFLVKTKQVSDGEATFCKFRQLRKCTRYYLKSLEQHLPDEFHKMLKGFLPPKTVLPQVLGSPSPSSDT